MQQGKKLIYNHKWFSDTCDGELTNVCSPLAFACLFNHDWFVGYAKKIQLQDGMSINRENSMIDKFFSYKGVEPSIQQYTVFETNGKFTLQPEILKDIFSDTPDRETDCYVYYLYVVGRKGIHKRILLRTISNFYLIDSNLSNIVIYGIEEFLNFAIYNDFSNITNLSVLFYPLSNKWYSYETKDFSHLI